MKTSTLINLVLVFCLCGNMFAQEANITLNFLGQDSNTGNNIELESVYIKNVTQNCDTTVFGPEPSLNLSWPSAMDDFYTTSGFSIGNCFPNPFLGSTSFTISVDNYELISIYMYNIYGSIVSEFKKHLNKGIHTFNILGGKNSLYYLSVSNETIAQTQKLLNQSSEGGNLVQLNYIGSEQINAQYKSSTEISSFIFQPGDQLEMRLNDSEYMGFTIYDYPNEDSLYNFQLSLIEKKVLLEFFSGHKSVNNPEAEFYIYELQEQYGNQLSIVSIHAGYYAYPDASGLYTTDFRCDVGNDLYSYFGVIMNPVAMINRGDFGNGILLNQGDWATILETEIMNSPEAFILIENNYNTQTKELITSLEIKLLEVLDGDFNVCVFLIEDNNVAPQKNNNPEVGPIPDWTDYNHRNVLRASLNGTWGELIASGNISSGSIYTLQMNSFTLNNEWKDEDCATVAFLYNTETLEILQVAELDIL